MVQNLTLQNKILHSHLPLLVVSVDTLASLHTYVIMEPEELQKVASYFEEMGVKPKLDSKEDFEKWMSSYTLDIKPIKSEEKVSNDPFNRIPRLPNFTGSSDQKDATPYEVWRYELESILFRNLYPPEIIAESIRRSLKGEAAKVAMRLGVGSSPMELLRKFDGLYGTVASETSLLTQFYSSQQGEKEDVSAWSVRLEDIIQKVGKEEMISRSTLDEMMRSKLWTGLYDDRLKQATRYKYETTKKYDELIVELRKIEQELCPSAKSEKKAKTHMLQRNITDKDEDNMKSILTRLERKMDKLDDLEGRITKLESDKMKRGPTANTAVHNRGRGFRGRGRRFCGTANNRPHEKAAVEVENGEQQEMKQTPILCYRCGQPGHVARGCRVQTSQSGHLNRSLSLPRGGH